MQSSSQAAAELASQNEAAAGMVTDMLTTVDRAAASDQEFVDATRDVASKCSEHVNNFCDANASEVSTLALGIQVCPVPPKQAAQPVKSSN